MSSFLIVGENGMGESHRMLFYANMSSLPPNAIITDVAFQAFAERAGDDISFNVSLHALSQDWGEGSSVATGGECAAASDDDATWNYTYFGAKQRWTTPGGSFGSALAISSVNQANRTYQWRSHALTAQAQAWLEKPNTNFGFILRTDKLEVSVRKTSSFCFLS
jgi:hypothetical protein